MARPSESPNGAQHPNAGLARTTRLVGGLLLLVVLGATLGAEGSGRWSHSAREHAAQELAGARRAGERVARAFWTLVSRQEAAPAPGSAATGWTARPRMAIVVDSAPVRSRGVEIGAWLLDLPPPAAA